MTAFLTQLFQMSLWGSVLTAVILLVKRLAGERLSAVFHYAIWGVLLLRLVIPFSPSYMCPLPVSESEMPPLTERAEEASNAAQKAAEAMHEGIQTAKGARGGTLPAAGAAEPQADPPAGTAQIMQSAERQAAGSELPPGFAQAVRKLLCWGYLLGAMAYVAVIAISLIHYRRELLPDEQPDGIPALFAAERERLNMSKRTCLRVAVSGSPYASGVLFPCVTIPLSLTVDFEDTDLRAVFRHELTHIHYGDTALRALLVVLQGLYWFNPVLWYAFACIRRDGEYACDARVLRRSSPAEQISYGKALLNVAELYARKTSILYSTFAVRPLRRRIEKIIAYRPARRGTKLAAVPLVLICLTVGIAVSAQGVEVLTLDAEGLNDDRAWSWSPEYPMLAELPEEDMALYAVDAALLDEGEYSDWSYSGRVALRQGDEVQLCSWAQTYADGWPEITPGDYDQNGSQEYAFADYGYATFVGERNGTLRMVRRGADGLWDGEAVLDGYAVKETVSRQFAAGAAANGSLTFTLNGETHRIALPEDLRGKPLLRLEVLPYVRFHTGSDALSVSVAIGAYFDEHPVFAGYLNAPVTYSKGMLAVGTAAFAGSFFRDYPEDWLRLYDAETGLTLGLPPHWEGNYVSLDPYVYYDRNNRFDLYERYNYELPPKYDDDVHFGFILSFYTSQPVYEDFYTFLGYRDGLPFDYTYAHGVEFDSRDPKAKGRY